MPLVRFDGFVRNPHYRSWCQRSWWAGEVREVSEEQAAYLTEGWSEFSVVEKPGQARRTKAPTPSHLDVLDQSIAKLRDELAGGAYDDHLAELLEAEQDGSTRSGAIRVLEDRLAATREG